jgi:hypothetical protein
MRMAPRTKRSASRLAGSPRSSAMSGEDAAMSQPFYVRGEPCLKEAIYLRLALSEIGCGSFGGKADEHLWDTSGCLSSRWSGYSRDRDSFPQPQQFQPSLFYSMNWPMLDNCMPDASGSARDHASRAFETAFAVARFNATKPPAAPPSTFSTCAMM